MRTSGKARANSTSRRLGPLQMLASVALVIFSTGCNTAPAPASNPVRGWREVRAAGPSPRWGHVAAFDQRRKSVIVFGGQGEIAPLNDTWRFGLESEEWEVISATAPPSPRFTSAVIADGARDRMIIVGGNAGAASEDVFALSLASRSWSRLAAGPSARYDAMAATDGTKAWVFGGFADGLKPLNDLWQLDLETDRWSPLPSNGTSPAPTTNGGFGYSNGSLYLTGGHDEKGLTPRSYVYDLAKESWSSLEPAGTADAHAHFAYATDKECGELILYGGDRNDQNDVSETAELQMRQPSTSRFSVLPSSVSPPRRRHSAIAVDGASRQIVMFGGWQGSRNILADTWIYDRGSCD